MDSLSNYVILDRLGDGAIGTVNLVKRLADGKRYAMKKVRVNQTVD